MSKLESCEHLSLMSFLEDIEYNEDENFKEVAITFTCADCGSRYTRWWNLSKKKDGK